MTSMPLRQAQAYSHFGKSFVERLAESSFHLSQTFNDGLAILLAAQSFHSSSVDLPIDKHIPPLIGS